MTINRTQFKATSISRGEQGDVEIFRVRFGNNIYIEIGRTYITARANGKVVRIEMEQRRQNNNVNNADHLEHFLGGLLGHPEWRKLVKEEEGPGEIVFSKYTIYELSDPDRLVEPNKIWRGADYITEGDYLVQLQR